MKVKPLVLAPVLALAAGTAITAFGSGAAADVGSATYSPTSPMVAVTANIGRNYDSGSKIREVMSRIKRNVNNVSNGRPRFLGWQEIDEADPVHEMRILKDVYRYDWGWRRSLYRTRPDGTREPLKVPTVAHDAQKSSKRVVFGSSGMRRISPTRWITITRFRNQNVTFVNTHFIAKAWSGCPSRCAERRDRWRAHWRHLKEEVAQEHNAGFNVILTGDFNRRPKAGVWKPQWVHPAGRHVKGGGGIDHIVAVPRSGWKVIKVRYSNGNLQQGKWWIGIDGHEAHWVKVRFLRR